MISFAIICIVLISSKGDASLEDDNEDTSQDLWNLDLCFQNPCQNNGTCKDVGGEGRCECILPYSGEDCSKDPCSTQPCQNDGKCDVSKYSYKCTCENGFFGENCEYRATEPSSSTILLERTVSTSTQSTLHDFIGKTSPLTTSDTTIEKTTKQIVKIDYCYDKHCKNGGTCIEKNGEYKCVCSPQYSGDTCEKVVYSCEMPCQNGGICKKKNDEIKCECVEPYSGSLCEQGPCEPNPCKNDGVCTISQNTYNCTCFGLYTGKNCTDERILDYCYESPCLNGGTCIREKKGFKCNCPLLYSGENCNEKLEISTITPLISTETTFSSTNSPTVETTFSSTNSPTEPTTTTTTPGTTHETTMHSTAISTQEPKTTSSTTRPTIETTMHSTAISTQEPKSTSSTTRPTIETTMYTKTKPTQDPTTTTTTTARGTTRDPKRPSTASSSTTEYKSTTSEVTTVDHDLCISSPCLNNGSCISIDNSERCNCTYPFSGKFCDTDLSEKHQSSSNSIVYACTGSAGAIVFVFLVGFSVLWHLKRVKRRKKESYFHNADVSSMESENSRTYII